MRSSSRCSSISLVSLCLLLALPVCVPFTPSGDDGDPGDGEGEEGEGDEDDDDDDDACAAGDRSRGPSEACCLDFGADACGANLFCAAFDGRSVPTCYVEGTRLDGEACSADVHCVSRSCRVPADDDVGVCRALPGQPCDVDVGCAPFGGDAHACVVSAGVDNDARCLVASPRDGGNCDADAGCDSGICAGGRCSAGDDGDACASADDCRAGGCVAGVCSDGRDGSPCGADVDCAGARCVDAVCRDGRFGSPCDDESDCEASLLCDGTCRTAGVGDECSDDAACSASFSGCFDGVCTRANEGGACDSDPECGTASCVDGACVAVCADSTDCFLQGLFSGTALECREARCTVVGEQDAVCTENSDCATDLGGFDCSNGQCKKRSGLRCERNDQCATAACTAVTGPRCVRNSDGFASNVCDDNADCSADERCLNATVAECG